MLKLSELYGLTGQSVTLTDTGDQFTTDTVESALQQLGGQVTTLEQNPQGGATVLGTLTQTMAPANEAIINLSEAASLPDVSVTKELFNLGVVSNDWNIAPNDPIWDLHDSAPSVVLTPGATTGTDIDFTLGAGTWNINDIGKTIINKTGTGRAVIASLNVSNSTTFTALSGGMVTNNSNVIHTSESSSPIGSNSAMLFDGSSFLTFANSVALDDLTVEMWVLLPTGYSFSDNAFASNRDPNDAGNPDGWHINATTSGGNQLQFGIKVSGSWDILFRTGADKISIGTWHHIAVTRQGSTLRWFVDGQVIATASGTANPITGANVYLGGAYGSSKLKNGVKISSFRVGNSCLYTGPFTPTTSPFVVDTGTTHVLNSEESINDIATADITEDFPDTIDISSGGWELGCGNFQNDGKFRACDEDKSVAITNSQGQINTTDFTDMNSMSVTDAPVGGSVNYAFSTDAKTTWQIVSKGDFHIQKSALFDGVDDYVSRTPTVVGNQKTWTFSCWVKRSTITDWDTIFNNGPLTGASDSNWLGLRFDNVDRLLISSYTEDIVKRSTAKFRDTSKFLHVFVVFNTTNDIAEDRIKIYVDGIRMTSFDTSLDPVLNGNYGVGLDNPFIIGAYTDGSFPFSGYMSDVVFLDGQALTADDFGEFNSYGQWIPRDLSNLDYSATNSFYLPFNLVSGIVDDASGNGNNFSNYGGMTIATSRISDTPTENYCTLNPLCVSSSVNNITPTFSAGNTVYQNTTSYYYCNTVGTLATGPSGKFYFEHKIHTKSNLHWFGVADLDIIDETHKMNGGSQPYLSSIESARLHISNDPITYLYTQIKNGAYAGQTCDTNMLAGVTVGCAVDMDNRAVWFHINGNWITPSGSTVSSAQVLAEIEAGNTANAVLQVTVDNLIPVVGGACTASNASEIRFGARSFDFSPPAGFVPLTTGNVSDAAIQPTENFSPVIYSGDGSVGRSIDCGFQPDLVWIKQRDNVRWHYLTDSVRGIGKELYANETNAEAITTNGINSFDTNGFTVGDNNGVNDPTGDYVAWCWKAGNTPPQAPMQVTEQLSDGAFTTDTSDWTNGTGVGAIVGGGQSGNCMQVTSVSGSYGYVNKVITTTPGQKITFSGYYKLGTSAEARIAVGTGTSGFPSNLYYGSGLTATSWTAFNVTVYATTTSTVFGFQTVGNGKTNLFDSVSITLDVHDTNNTDGTISSYVSANVDAGFSIVSYTGTNVINTVGHGLSQAPEMVIIKNRTSTGGWRTQHKDLSTGTAVVSLDSTNAEWDGATYFTGFPTSSVIQLGNSDECNKSLNEHIAYCWHSVPGYSKIGSYTGNNTSDNAFVYCGFKPAFVLIKNVDSVNGWRMFDSAREPYNVVGGYLDPSSSDTEVNLGGGNTNDLDFLDNGFKLRGNAASIGGDGSRAIFIAFAENPFHNEQAATESRNIARDNAGTWEINTNSLVTGTTWTSATVNNMFTALQEAAAVSQNQMDSVGVNLVADAEWPALTNTLDFAMMIDATAAPGVPEVSNISFNYDVQSGYEYLTLGTDYDVTQESDTSLRFTSNTSGNLHVKVRG